MVNEDDFLAALDEDPSNSTLRLVFADWLEEMGDWRAVGYRWMGQAGKWPYDWSTHKLWVGVPYTHDWCMIRVTPTWDVPEHCRLPAWFSTLLVTTMPSDWSWIGYPTRAEAELAVCQVIANNLEDFGLQGLWPKFLTSQSEK